MLAHLFRRTVSRAHPTPEQALDALREGQCLYSPVSTCSGGPGSVGLRDGEDNTRVLACSAHVGRLRRLSGRELDNLERHLLAGFGRQVTPREREDEGPRVIVV